MIVYCSYMFKEFQSFKDTLWNIYGQNEMISGIEYDK